MRVQTLLAGLSMGMLFAVSATSGGCGGGASTSNDAGSDSTMGTGGTKGAGTGGTTGAGTGGTTGSGSGGSSGAATGGSSGTGAGGTTGTGGTKGTGAGGTKGTGAGGTSGSSATDAGGDSGAFTCSGTDCCPTTPCSKGDVCCANVTAMEAGAAFQCVAPSGCTSDDTLGCTSPGDCTGGDFCCVTAVFVGSGSLPGCLKTNIQDISSTCSAAGSCKSDLKFSCAATDTARMCTTSKDCTEAGYTDCCDLPLGSRTYAACVPSLVKTVDPSIVCH